MKSLIRVVSVASALLLASLPMTASAGQSIGAGLHYLRAVGDFDDIEELEKDSFGIIGSYQIGLPLFKFEANAEYVFDYLGTDEALFEPSAYALIGALFYAGAGIGIGHVNDDWQSDPFYAVRAGVDLPLGPVNLDAYGTYRFQKDEDLEEFDEDLNSVTVAAVVRKSFGISE